MISTLCRCLLSLNNFGSQMGSKNITSSTSFLFTVFTFSLKSHAHHPDERTADHWPAKFNLYLRKWGSKERHTTLHICWQFSQSNRVWIFGPASVPYTMKLKPGIFAISMNIGTGQSTSQLWNFSSLYRKKWTIVYMKWVQVPLIIMFKKMVTTLVKRRKYTKNSFCCFCDRVKAT